MKAFKNVFVAVSLAIATSGFSQTIDAPHLHCATVLANGDVQLDWSNVNSSCGPLIARYIYASSTSANGPYNLIYSVTNPNQTQYTQIGANGNSTTWWYYMRNDYNCFGATELNSDTIDNLDPVPPQTAYVTVNGYSGVDVAWFYTQSPEIWGYIIYLFQNGVYTPIDTIYDPWQWNYLDTISGSNPDTGEVAYSIAAFDSCFNTGPIYTPNHHTVYLQVDTPGVCDSTIHMQWTAYDYWTGTGVAYYHIYVAGDGAPAQFVTSIPPNQLQYDYVNVNGYSSLIFVVYALSDVSGWISQSNLVTVPAFLYGGPKNFFIRNATVVAPNEVQIDYSMDPGFSVDAFAMERSSDGGNSYGTLSNISVSSISAGINTFYDSTALTDKASYCYRLAATDSCGKKSYSSEGCSILLQGNAFTDGTNSINWNASSIGYGSSVGYNVMVDNAGIFSTVGTTPGNGPYTFEQQTDADSTCYVVESSNQMTYPNGVSEIQISRSNELCLTPPPQIYLPNAFAPEGTNKVFLPIFNVSGIATYSMHIFNRWGEMIFTTSDPQTGWDGNYKGKLAQQGAYAYSIKVTDENGQTVEKNGTVLLLR